MILHRPLCKLKIKIATLVQAESCKLKVVQAENAVKWSDHFEMRAFHINHIINHIINAIPQSYTSTTPKMPYLISHSPFYQSVEEPLKSFLPDSGPLEQFS